MTTGQKLKMWRKRLRLSQKDAAKLIPCSPPALCDWENEKKLPDLENAEAIERATGIPMRAWAKSARDKRIAASAKGAA